MGGMEAGASPGVFPQSPLERVSMAGAESKLHPHCPMHTLGLFQGSVTEGRKEPTGYSAWPSEPSSFGATHPNETGTYPRRTSSEVMESSPRPAPATAKPAGPWGPV